MRTLVVAAAFALASDARAEIASLLEGGLGGLLVGSTSSVDHAKLGIHASIQLSDRRPWVPLLSADVAFLATGPVNPGAVPVSSAPDVNETRNGNASLQLRAWLKTPVGKTPGGPGGYRLLTGFTWYYLDVKSPAVGSMEASPTLGVDWFITNYRTLSFEGIGAFAVNWLGSFAIAFLPEAKVKWLPSERFGLELALRAAVLKTIRDNPFAVIIPGVTAGIYVSI